MKKVSKDVTDMWKDTRKTSVAADFGKAYRAQLSKQVIKAEEWLQQALSLNENLGGLVEGTS